MEESSSQQVLLKELSDLLGFEDGAEDVLEHLLTIDSREVGSTPRAVATSANARLPPSHTLLLCLFYRISRIICLSYWVL